MIWHDAPASAACIRDGKGWVYVSNSADYAKGCISALRFSDRGDRVESSWRISEELSMCGVGVPGPQGSWIVSGIQLKGGEWRPIWDSSRAAMLWSVNPHAGDVVAPKLITDVDAPLAAVMIDRVSPFMYLLEGVEWAALRRIRLTTSGDVSPGAMRTEVLTTSRRRDGKKYVSFTSTEDSQPIRFHRPVSACIHGGKVWIICDGGNSLYSYDLLKEDEPELVVADLGGAREIGCGTIAVSPSGTVYFAISSGGGIAKVSKYGEVTKILECKDFVPEIGGLAFSPNGRHLYFSTPYGSGGSGACGAIYSVAKMD
ncbi:hypothetical protein ACFWC5_39440 [Streptomyces sp. NPDC060085]|uniref:hypothetical protein n=1 Tax=Streptomyces sp. NPDC060085 TaxID=3347054 RepID=UPI0036544F6F